jgi:hypothetical protein
MPEHAMSEQHSNLSTGKQSDGTGASSVGQQED